MESSRLRGRGVWTAAAMGSRTQGPWSLGSEERERHGSGDWRVRGQEAREWEGRGAGGGGSRGVGAEDWGCRTVGVLGDQGLGPQNPGLEDQGPGNLRTGRSGNGGYAGPGCPGRELTCCPPGVGPAELPGWTGCSESPPPAASSFRLRRASKGLMGGLRDVTSASCVSSEARLSSGLSGPLGRALSLQGCSGVACAAWQRGAHGSPAQTKPEPEPRRPAATVNSNRGPGFKIDWGQLFWSNHWR